MISPVFDHIPNGCLNQSRIMILVKVHSCLISWKNYTSMPLSSSKKKMRLFKMRLFKIRHENETPVYNKVAQKVYFFLICSLTYKKHCTYKERCRMFCSWSRFGISVKSLSSSNLKIINHLVIILKERNAVVMLHCNK